MRRFDGKSVLITGGSSGIGLAAAQRLAEEGSQITLLARDPDKLDKALETLPGSGHSAYSCDVTDASITAKCVMGAVPPGGFHGAVLSAGAHDVRPLAAASSEHFATLYRDNVISALNVIRPFIKHAHRKSASIVLLSSVAAIRGEAAVAAYSGAKGALLAIARSLAVELARRQIRVNSIVAGVVKTPMTEGFLAKLTGDQRQAIESSHLLGLGEPADVAAAIAFLLSSDARWISGAELVVDGGLSCSSRKA